MLLRQSDKTRQRELSAMFGFLRSRPKEATPQEDLCSWITRGDKSMQDGAGSFPQSDKKHSGDNVMFKLRDASVEPSAVTCSCHGRRLDMLSGWHLVHDPSGASYEGDWQKVRWLGCCELKAETSARNSVRVEELTV